MKKLFLILILLLIAEFGFSQVGINTTMPDAQLDIKSSNQATPANNDGILIPKIDAFPLTNPTAAQNSMLVYLTVDLTGKPKGFYYWDNGTTSWKGVGGGGTLDQAYDFGGAGLGKVIIADTGAVTINGTDGLVSNGNYASGSDAPTGVGTKMFWNPKSASFRAGYISANQWDSPNLGNYSAAFGISTTATGLGSVAFGGNSIASGSYSVASGFGVTASGDRAVAFGNNTVASGLYSTAFGANSVASGSNSVAFGLVTTASGAESVAYGSFSTASGQSSTAFGRQNTAPSYGETVIGIGATQYTPSANGDLQFDIAKANDRLFVVGNAVDSNSNNIVETAERSNALIMLKNGNTSFGTNIPNAKLQIYASNQATPSNTDGIIIPRVNAFPLTNPTAAQNSMMVYLTTTSAGKLPGFYYWDNATTSWKGVGSGSGWSITGNAGTNPAINFIGTTDDQPIIFKANNLQVGRLESGILKNIFFGGNTGTTNGGYYNVGIGYSVLNNLTTGNLNVGIGLSALRDNLDGFWNTAIGANAMTYNISGNNNVAFGYGALFLNETGSNNTANGFFSLEANKSGSGNVGFGNGTLYSNIAGSNGIAIGKDAMYYANSTLTPFENKNIAIGFESLKGSTTTANNTGNFNTAIGYQTLLTNTTGYGNTVAGSSSLLANTTGYNNSIFGASAMSNNTTGFGNTTVGDYILPRPTQGSNLTAMGYASLFYYGNNLTTVFTNTNTAIGYQSMLSEHFGSVPGTNNIGLNNSVVGYNSLQGNSSGSNNTAIGYQTMFLNKTGNNNVAIGQETLNNNVLGSGNVALGYQAGFNELSSNKLYIENSNSTTPLIYGEFDNDLVRINGKTEGIYTQLIANGDGQSSIYGFRTRDSQNDGTSYSRLGTNKATSGYNLWGDLYTFGVTGHNDNDFTRTGGILGAVTGGTYWSSLGYKNSAAVTYGVYATAALATGAGRLSQLQSQYSIGGGFYGGLIGSWSKGSMFGSINSGSLFASYNSGDEYTQGKQIEIVTTGNSKTAAYTVTSTEIVVYKKGRITLLNGSAKVTFDENYVKLLGDIPIVTASPMGQCNGIYIESIDKYGFIIKELNNGISNVSVSWISVGDRVDATDASTEVLNKDFDENINQVMFNDNNLNQSAKAMWSNGNTINFGKLPENLKEKLENK